jgi:poly-gamma-glutamate system protein
MKAARTRPGAAARFIGFFRGSDFPRETGGRFRRALPILAGLSLLYYGAAGGFPPAGAPGEKDEREAAEIMARACRVLRENRLKAGLEIDPLRDVNRTGLIGLNFSPITTSIGRLEAKRTTLNPAFAGLAVRLLKEAGVRRSDPIAVGASGSFPGLILAVLSAARALRLRPLVICSLGASQWGANDPRFHWLKMWDCLREAGLFPWEPVAVTLGGGRDMGEDMEPEGRALLRRAIRDSGLPGIEEPVLERNVALRLRILEEAAGRRPIRAFVNIGGAYANLGTDAEILHVRPGLADIRKIPPVERRGMVFAMAAREVPVIHLLYVQGLARRFGLPWDPSPLPGPGEASFPGRRPPGRSRFLIWTLLYLAGIAAVLLIFRDRPPLPEKGGGF